MTIPARAFIEILREEFQRELASTGGYTRQGMTVAFERAMVAALLRAGEIEVRP